MGFPRHSLSPVELASMLESERTGDAFLAYRDGGGDLRFAPLGRLTSAAIGRGEDNEVELPWDAEVSRTHAQLVLVGGEWTLVDDGLSRNGSFGEEKGILGQRRLGGGDGGGGGGTPPRFPGPPPAPRRTAGRAPAAP